MNIKNQKDFFSGLMFMGAGVSFAFGASRYAIVNAARLGPGFFPLVLGVVLALLGGIITFKAQVVETVDGGPPGRFAWKPLICILLANLVFGAMLGGVPSIHFPPLGLIAGIYALTFIANLASDDFGFVETFVLASVLAGVSYLAFIKLLHLPFPVWPAFIMGAV